MRIGNEEVTLVTDFDELRAGVIIFLKGCRFCSKTHRGILVSQYTGMCVEPDGSEARECGAWEYLPIQPCCWPEGHVIARDAVASRRVYRVVDRALDAATTARKREAMRT